ncbi:MAG: hypothetical protein JXB38_07370, partial [Anaerolineales bacterium]|nr:hypothetical protein [Anaerolineales bacterium]
ILPPSETPIVPTITPTSSFLAINETTAASVELLAAYTSHLGSVTDMALLPGGEQVVSVSYDGENRIWDVLSMQDLHISTSSIENEARVAVIDDDLVVVARDGSRKFGGNIVIQNVADGTIVQEFEGRQFPLGVVFSPSGKHIATQNKDYKTIIVWDVLTGQSIQRISGDWSDTGDRPWTGAFSPDGSILVVLFTNSDLVAYDVNSGKELHRFMEGGLFEFLGDGEVLAVSRANVIQLYDTRSWELISEFGDNKLKINFTSFAHHSNIVAIGQFGGEIQIWDMQNGSLLTTLHDPSGFLNMRFSFDDRYIFTYRGQNGQINIWGIP